MTSARIERLSLVALDWTGDGWSTAADVASVTVGLLTFVTLGLLLYQYVRERKRTERAREEQAFETATTHYLRFLELCLENPDLTLAELDTDRLEARDRIEGMPGSPPSKDVRRRDALLYEYFFQVLEKVFVLYRADEIYPDPKTNEPEFRKLVLDWATIEAKSSGNGDYRHRQWWGWESWINDYSRANSFRAYWKSLKNDATYDSVFMAYMNLITENPRQPKKPHHGALSTTEEEGPTTTQGSE